MRLHEDEERFEAARVADHAARHACAKKAHVGGVLGAERAAQMFSFGAVGKRA